VHNGHGSEVITVCLPRLDQSSASGWHQSDSFTCCSQHRTVKLTPFAIKRRERKPSSWAPNEDWIVKEPQSCFEHPNASNGLTEQGQQMHTYTIRFITYYVLITNMFRSLLLSSIGYFYKVLRIQYTPKLYKKSTLCYNKGLKLSIWSQNVRLYITKQIKFCC